MSKLMATMAIIFGIGFGTGSYTTSESWQTQKAKEALALTVCQLSSNRNFGESMRQCIARKSR